MTYSDPFGLSACCVGNDAALAYLVQQAYDQARFEAGAQEFMQNSAPSLIMMAVGTGISSIVGPLFEGESAVAAEGVTIDAAAAEETASISGILRAAARGKGNFGVGTATATEAEAAGRAWVGEGAAVASDGKTLVSADGLRQYRPGTFKPKLGRTQANLEWRLKPEGKWQGNGHIDIVPK